MDFSKFKEFSRKLHFGKDPAHDFTHNTRIIELCNMIAPHETDMNLVIQAAYLHGGGSSQENIRKQVHSFLQSQGFTEPHIQKIIKTMRNSGSSKKPQTMEEKVLYDANILDALRAVGIARAYTKGGYEHQTLRETTEIMKQNMERPLYTPKAKETARQRKRIMNIFLNALEEELASLI